MDFSLSEEQKLIIDTTKKFVETELFPHEELVEKTGNLPLLSLTQRSITLSCSS